MSELAKSLVEAQKKLPAVPKNATADVPTKNGGKYSYSYATLDSLIAKTLPVLNEHGLAITQSPEYIDGYGFGLRTTLTHTSGEVQSSVMPIPHVGHSMQDLGGAITYARRYAWSSVLGIASEHDDDAGAITHTNGGGTVAQPAASRPMQRETTESAAASSTTSFTAPDGATSQEAQNVRNREAAGRVRKLFGAEKYKDKTIAEIAELEGGVGHLEWIASDKFEPKQDAQKHFKQAAQTWLGMEPLPVGGGTDDDIPFDRTVA